MTLLITIIVSGRWLFHNKLHFGDFKDAYGQSGLMFAHKILIQIIFTRCLIFDLCNAIRSYVYVCLINVLTG